jgi:hypothetical protein
VPRLTPEQRQQVRAAFVRTRRGELLFSVPTIAGLVLVAQVAREPNYAIGPLRGMQLVAPAVLLIVVGLRLHLRNWVCPACRRPLRRGLTVGCCPQCGAVLLQPRRGETEAHLAERAALREGEWVGLVHGLQLAVGALLVAAAGVIAGLSLAARHTLTPPALVTAGVLLVFGLWLVVIGVRRGSAQRREEIVRQRLGLAPVPSHAEVPATAATAPTVAPPPPAVASASAAKVAPSAASSFATASAASTTAPPATTTPAPVPKKAAAKPKPKPKPATAASPPPGPPLSLVQQWAIAASANLCSPRKDRLDGLSLGLASDDVRETIATWWNINGPEDVEPTFSWLWHEGHSARLAASFQLLDSMSDEQRTAFYASVPAEQRRSLEFAREHRSEFKDATLVAWDMVRLIFVARAAYSAGYLDEARAWSVILEAARRLQAGYASWAEMSANYLAGRRFWSDTESQPLFDKHAAWLVSSSKSPWHGLDWQLPLGTIYVVN